MNANLCVVVGLQTPRLKRLAEIVSAQAIAQQEKLEFEPVDDSYSQNGDGDVDGAASPDYEHQQPQYSRLSQH